MKRSAAPVRVTRYVNAYATRDGRKVVAFHHRDGQVHREEMAAEHSLFVRKSDLDRAQQRELAKSTVVTAFREDGDFFRVSFKDDEVIRRLTRKPDGLFEKRGIQTYEGDVDPVRRWLTDNPDIGIQRPRTCYLDIEADSRVAFVQKRHARGLAWSVVDHATGESHSAVLKQDSDEAETEMWLGLWRVLNNFDQVLAWNGKRFDFPYLSDRTEYFGFPIEMRRWLWLDHMLLFKRMNVTASESGEEKQSFALEAIARVWLKTGKFELSEEDLEELAIDGDLPLGAQSWELWERAPHKLDEYCRRDAGLMRAIEKKSGFVEILFAVCEACGVFPDSYGLFPSAQVDGFLMKLAVARGLRPKTRVFVDEERKQFKGAHVFEVATGLHRYETHVLDFAAMYPSIIMTWNMSPETATDIRLKEDISARPSYLMHAPVKEYPLPAGHCYAANDRVFKAEPPGILAAAVAEIIRQRKEWSKLAESLAPGTDEAQEAKRRDIAYKQITNCFYGVVSGPFSRFHDERIGPAITATGAWLIKQVSEHVTRRGWKLVFGDTDSVSFSGATREEARAFVEYCNEQLFPTLLKPMCTPSYALKLAYEKSFRRICLVSKKRYFAMWAVQKGKEPLLESRPEVKGLEYKRGDQYRLTRYLQAEVINGLLGFDPEVAKRINEAPEGAERDAVRAASRMPAPIDEPAAYEAIVQRYLDHIFDTPRLPLEDAVQSAKLAKSIGDYSRKEKKTAPKYDKLRGEDVVLTYSDHECLECGSTPASELELHSGKCTCGDTWSKRRSIAKGYVTRANGERLAISDGKRTVFVWTTTIDHVVVYNSLAQHVIVAKTLQQRGRDVGAGTRVEFVVTDDEDPFGVIPAEDYRGTVDRYHLWEKVFTPTLRILEVVFPAHQWTKFNRLRPHVVQARAVRAVRAEKKKAPQPFQRSLF